MKFGVVRFPGSDCDDAVHLLSTVLAGRGSRGRIVAHDQNVLGEVDAVVLPGGVAPIAGVGNTTSVDAAIMAAVVEFANAGGPVLGICGGFHALCAAGLLDGALAGNTEPGFLRRDVHVVVEGRPTPFTQAIPAGRHIRMSVAHARGRFTHDDVDQLEAEGRVVFRYCTADGGVYSAANPNGSVGNIAGICNAVGNVVGLMPHPERACDDSASDDGHTLFESALAWQAGSPSRVGG